MDLLNHAVWTVDGRAEVPLLHGMDVGLNAIALVVRVPLQSAANEVEVACHVGSVVVCIGIWLFLGYEKVWENQSLVGRNQKQETRTYLFLGGLLYSWLLACLRQRQAEGADCGQTGC